MLITIQIQGVTKNGPPLLQNFPLLDYFPCNFDCHCVLQTYTKEFTFISFCQKFLKNAWKNGLRGVQILVRGSIFFVTPYTYLKQFTNHNGRVGGTVTRAPPIFRGKKKKTPQISPISMVNKCRAPLQFQHLAPALHGQDIPKKLFS